MTAYRVIIITTKYLTDNTISVYKGEGKILPITTHKLKLKKKQDENTNSSGSITITITTTNESALSRFEEPTTILPAPNLISKKMFWCCLALRSRSV